MPFLGGFTPLGGTINEQNETNDEQDTKRWTAKRRAALVLEILRGQPTVADAARTHCLKASDISAWVRFYNNERLMRALNYRSPAQRCAAPQLPKAA